MTKKFLPEFFGNEYQISLQEQCLQAWPTLAGNPKINFSGRNFGWDRPAFEDIEAIVDLVNRFGLISIFAIPETMRQSFIEALTAHQLEIETWGRFRSTEATEKLCAAILEQATPPGYRIALIDQATPDREVREFQTVMQSCGVAPLPGYVLRGKKIRSVAVMIKAANNSIVATAIGVLRHHPAGEFRKAAHAGFLAVKPEHRRKGLATVALAKVNQLLIEAYEVEQDFG